MLTKLAVLHILATAAFAEDREYIEEAEWEPCAEHRSCWRDIKPMFDDNVEKPQCFSDYDCAEGHYCLQHMWTVKDQLETGRGCWREDVCQGSATYDMFISRTQQWFCSDEQIAEQEAKGVQPITDWDIVLREEKHWDTYQEACVTDADCPRPDLGQVCQKWFFYATEDEKNWSNGSVCYNWSTPVCPGPTFAA